MHLNKIIIIFYLNDYLIINNSYIIWFLGILYFLLQKIKGFKNIIISCLGIYNFIFKKSENKYIISSF